MASLNNILNPEQRKRSVKLLVNPPQQQASPAAWPGPPSSSSEADGDEDVLAHNPHIPHPDCPDSLACLPDTDGRPQHTLPVILRCAILGSPKKRLTIRDIYAAMEEKYAYYRTAGPTWKQSVRHHLSLNRLFERQPRPATEPGFGSYWTVNLLAPPGTKRPRKRGRPNKDARPPGKATPIQPIFIEQNGPTQKPTPQATPVAEHRSESAMSEDDEEVDMLHYEEDELDSQISECESEEKLLLHPFERRQSLSGRLTPYDSSAGCHISPRPPPIHAPNPPPHQQPPSPAAPSQGTTDDFIERLQMEMANLRRQSADAISMSMRLSDQLAHAEGEVARVHSALEQTQIQLRDEVTRRRQAERDVEQAIKLRGVAEEALKEALRYSSEVRR